MVKRKTLDKNGKEKNGQEWLREKHGAKMAKRKTLDKNEKEKNWTQMVKRKTRGIK